MPVKFKISEMFDNSCELFENEMQHKNIESEKRIKEIVFLEIGHTKAKRNRRRYIAVLAAAMGIGGITVGAHEVLKSAGEIKNNEEVVLENQNGLALYEKENSGAIQMEVETDIILPENLYKDGIPITTNGLLLNDANIKFLAENEIGLAISIDGPQKEHDRLRVKIDGSGSFEQIANNIKKLSEAYPYYFRTRVNAVCVFDPKTDIEKVEEFYEELEKTYNIPRAIFVNKVSDNETNYYDQFSDTDNQKYDDRIKNLMRKFHEKKVADKEISSYLSAIAGGGPMSVIVRRRIDEIQGHCIKSSGACIPGQKICVNSSGIFDICERVNGHNSIGNVEQGIDGKAVLKIMKEYNEVALEDCSNCPIKKLCGYCYLNFETENGFKKNKAGCAFHRNVVKTNLSRYVSIYEENPNCRYFLDTDTAELENN